MPSWLRIAWNGARTFWWAIVLVIVAVLFGWLYLVKKGKQGRVDSVSSDVAKPFVEVVANRLQESVTDVKVERAIIGSETAMRRKELEEVRKEPDGKKRRERLAGILKKSI
jgi:hypothetical protein